MLHAFHIFSQKKSFVVCAQNQDDKEMWMHAFLKCLAPFLEKDSVIKKPKQNFVFVVLVCAVKK